MTKHYQIKTASSLNLKLIQLAFAILIIAMAFTANAAGGGGGSSYTSGKANYFELPAPFTVNILDKRRMRFMQISINLMSMDADAIAAVQTHMAPIRHELLMLFTHRDISEVMGIQAREALRSEALQKVQGILTNLAHIDSKGEHTTEEGTKYLTGVQELLFTSFVIQ